MLRIERLTLRLPAGYQHRAPAIARLVGEGLGQWRPQASQTSTHGVVPPVRIPPQASDRAIAQAIVAGIVGHLDRTYANTPLAEQLTTVIPAGTPESSSHGWQASGFPPTRE